MVNGGSSFATVNPVKLNRTRALQLSACTYQISCEARSRQSETVTNLRHGVQLHNHQLEDIPHAAETVCVLAMCKIFEIGEIFRNFKILKEYHLIQTL